MRSLARLSFSVLLTLLPLTAGATEPDPAPGAEPKAGLPVVDPSAETPAEPTNEHADEAEGDPGEVLVEAEAKAKAKSSKSKAKKVAKPRGDEACDFRVPVYTHVVAEGEHLGVIAGRYGVLSKDIVALNPELDTNPNLIRIGQKLRVCPEIAPREIVEQEHVVASGETFNAIALRYGLTATELLEQQDGKLADPNRLRIGQRLHVITVGEIVPGFEPEAPQPGTLGHARKLPESEHYTIKRPHNAFGTPHTIKAIGKALDHYQRTAKGGPKIRIGDISREGGGPMQGHLSHQEGRDVDVGLVLTGKFADRLHFSGATAETLDVERTWLLVESFLATGEVRVIFLDYDLQKLLYEHAKQSGVPQAKLDEYFQYPRGVGRNHGIIRHWRGHENHLHVRFRN